MAKRKTASPTPEGTISIDQLTPDDRNANKHSDRGRKVVKQSLEELGAGRSILVDRENRIIAGNLTAEQAKQAGIRHVRIVETTGDELIAVRRTDLSLDDPKARRLAIVDNRAQELSLSWDDEVLQSLDAEGIQIQDLFRREDVTDAEESRVDVEDLFPYKVYPVLLSVPLESAHHLKKALSQLQKIPGIVIDEGMNLQ